MLSSASTVPISSRKSFRPFTKSTLRSVQLVLLLGILLLAYIAFSYRLDEHGSTLNTISNFPTDFRTPNHIPSWEDVQSVSAVGTSESNVVVENVKDERDSNLRRFVDAANFPESAKQYITFVSAEIPLYAGTIRKIPTYTSYDEAIRDIDLVNTGNYVWQYGAYLRLPDFSRSKTCNQSHSSCLKELQADASAKTIVLYRPVANVFNERRLAEFRFENVLLKSGGLPLFVGIGIQASFRKSGKSDLLPGGVIETRAEEFSFREGEMTLLKELQELKIPMFTRGHFTTNATRATGYQYAISNGCPSLMISGDVRLGETLERKYNALKSRIGDRSLKVAINLKNLPEFFLVCKRILDDYPNSLVYAQGITDFRRMKGENIPLDRIRIFSDVEEWRESMRRMDVSIGGRIHGNMVALSVGVPVFVVAPDHRVLELAERMRIPHTTLFGDAVRKGMDVAEVVSATKFDGAAFDRNRCEIAQTYLRVFRQFGIGVQPHVRSIAEIC